MSDLVREDAFPSLPGGAASKTADLYERAWTVQSLLDLLSGEVTQIRLEEQRPDGLGVEFSRVLKSGEVEYHSVKRQAPNSAGLWTRSQLKSEVPSGTRSILSDLFGHLADNEPCRAVFASTHIGFERAPSANRVTMAMEHPISKEEWGIRGRSC